jgi:hypothetical protein
MERFLFADGGSRSAPVRRAESGRLRADVEADGGLHMAPRLGLIQVSPQVFRQAAKFTCMMPLCDVPRAA